MTIFPSPFAFRASMTRWAPPSLEKRTWPYNIKIKSTHVIYNTSSNDKLGARLKRRPEWWEGLHKDEAKEVPTEKEISFYFKRKKERVRLHEHKAKGMTSLRECKNNILQLNTYKHNNISNPTSGKNTKFRHSLFEKVGLWLFLSANAKRKKHANTSFQRRLWQSLTL